MIDLFPQYEYEYARFWERANDDLVRVIRPPYGVLLNYACRSCVQVSDSN